MDSEHHPSTASRYFMCEILKRQSITVLTSITSLSWAHERNSVQLIILTIPCRGELWVLKCAPAAQRLTTSLEWSATRHTWSNNRAPVTAETPDRITSNDGPANRWKHQKGCIFWLRLYHIADLCDRCTGNASLRRNTWEHSGEILRNNYAFLILFFFCTKLPLLALSSPHPLLSLSWLLTPFTPSRKQFSPPRKLRVALRRAEDKSLLFRTHRWRL